MAKSGKGNAKKSQKSKEDHTQEIENVGNLLRTLRIERGLSISDVCEATRISETNLNAIEDRNFSALPADTFVRGLLNIYARFLGQDPGPIVTSFMEERAVSQLKGRRSRAKQAGRSVLKPKRLAEPAHVSSVSMAGILLLVIIVIFTGFCLYTSWNPFSFLIKETENLPAFVTDLVPATRPADQGAPALTEPIIDPLASDGSVAMPPPYRLAVQFIVATGVEIMVDEGQPERMTVVPGDERSWDAARSAVISFDVPSSAMITVNDVSVPFPPAREGGHVLRIPADISPPTVNE